MNDFVRRTCTDVAGGESGSAPKAARRPLEEFAETSAYVLLGAPGSGKTTELQRQASASGGQFVTARDFLTFHDKPEWHDVTLFIDALDEVRSGQSGGRTPLDAIRAKLDQLGCPQFRLSCREADWFGSNDRHRLEAVSPDGSVRVLHLDPLSEGDAEDILTHRHGIGAPEAFIHSARDRGVDGLLVNPQTLGLLSRAVQEDDWPSTRTETFERACEKLVREHNREHRIAELPIVDASALMRTAGKLFAVQLMAGAVGYDRLHGEGNGDYLALEDIPYGNGEEPSRALRTNLFKAPDGERILPFHRQIAEFVAARYLAKLVADGLPAGRILALMTGLDGTIVTDLRGLGAWFAAQSPSSRAELIERDPLGTVLYGDVQGFTHDEKLELLEHFEQGASENPWFVGAIYSDSRIGDLVFPGVHDLFRDRTLDSRRDDRRQAFVAILVEVLAHGAAVDGVGPDLFRVVSDATWWRGTRRGALEALKAQCKDQPTAWAKLKELAHDVYEGRVEDPDDDLLGWLLIELYPEMLTPSEVLGFLRASKQPGQLLSYEYFWQQRIAERSNCVQLAGLLDGLVEMREWLYTQVREQGERANSLRRVPSNLLARYLSTCQKEPDPHRLFDWLGLAGWVGDWGWDIRIGSSARERICNWIGERPELWKEIMELGLRHSISSVEERSQYSFDQLIWQERERRLFGAPPPLDYGCWCLERALVVRNGAAAAWLMHRVAEAAHRSSGEELSINDIHARIAGIDILQREFEQRLDALRANEKAERNVRENPARRLLERRSEWQALVRESEVELRENRADPRLLHRLAKAYLGGYGDVVGRTPRERLNNLLGEDEELVETVLAGIRGAVARDDLPSDDEVVALGARQRMHFLSYPFLAGLNEIQPEASTWNGFADPDLARLALALHYNVPVWPESWEEADRKPRWFEALLNELPELVTDVLVRTARSELRNGRDFSQYLFDLAYSADHEHVASQAASSILNVFPVRCVEQQLSSLRYLLIAACLYCEPETLIDLIEKKLKSRSMNVAQRVYWLGAGLIVRSALFVDRLESYVAGHYRRILRLSQFFANRSDTPRELIQNLDIAALSLLIRTVGASHRPNLRGTGSGKAVWVTPGMEAADRVHGLINTLAGNASDEASEHLERLAEDVGLAAWHAHLADAKNRQKGVRRDASFVHATVGQVLGVLGGGKPANAADLAALTVEHLRQLARFSQDGNSSRRLQYWNVDSYNRAERPRPENACRDALLSDLQHRLGPLDIDVQPEGRYADTRRADIRVAFGGFNVPIEIKRSCHKDLWSGIRQQLMAEYARDPGADGYGIYAVFWFGDTEHCRPTPAIDGIPQSAADVEKRLVDGLSAEEKKKIAICLIDVANPPRLSDPG